MEDIRFDQTNNTLTFGVLLLLLKKYWVKILIVLIIIFIISFPSIIGGLFGTWLSSLVSAFTKKYILSICL